MNIDVAVKLEHYRNKDAPVFCILGAVEEEPVFQSDMGAACSEKPVTFSDCTVTPLKQDG